MLQQYLASGRNLRKNLGQKEAIYAQADLLPQRNQIKADTKFREDELALSREGLAQEGKYNEQNLALSREGLDIDAANADRDFDLSVKGLKQDTAAAKRSNLLGVGKLGLDAYLGYSANADTPSSMIAGSDSKGGVTKAAGEFLSPSPSGGVSGVSGGGVFDTVTGAIKERPIATGLGAVAGSYFADDLAEALPGGEKEWAVAAPVAGAIIGNVASKYAAPVVSSLWKTVGSWFGF